MSFTPRTVVCASMTLDSFYYFYGMTSVNQYTMPHHAANSTKMPSILLLLLSLEKDPQGGPTSKHSVQCPGRYWSPQACATRRAMPNIAGGLSSSYIKLRLLYAPIIVCPNYSSLIFVYFSLVVGIAMCLVKAHINWSPHGLSKFISMGFLILIV
ncbi:hypothetical protein K469DRAFT_393667 [Zopfia rhizophila CBS 207.26]|uniref:Uncharacterized protein n=1 Tax=Zopfia rhizophila CBS 207.26 TaxID=1314779 RepID=A0A6A6ELR1_9PEZI|nr:hypothetical protein K469DRAFT_393667 [Zopfia rhizophila CBS 207.26]